MSDVTTPAVLIDEILNLASAIDAERSALKRLIEMRVEALTTNDEQHAPNSGYGRRLRAAIEEHGPLRNRRCNEIKELAGDAPEPARAMIYLAAAQLASGKENIGEALCRAAAAIPQPADGTAARQTDDASRYVFRLAGQFFRIQFGDEEGSIGSCKGGHDYRQLLQAPNRSIDASLLRKELASTVPQTIRGEGGSDDDGERDGYGDLSVNEARQRVAIASQDIAGELSELKDQIDETAGYIDRMKRENRLESEIEALERERLPLLERAQALTGLGGKPRLGKDKNLTAVANRTREFREACGRAGMTGFAAFLTRNVDIFESGCIYNLPENPPEWAF